MSGSTLTSGEDPANPGVSLGRKLLAHVAENGNSFEFECDGSTTVEAIGLSIQSLTGIPLSDQLFLYGYNSLDLTQPLSAYKLPQDDSEVFLYNKSRLHADSPLPGPEIIDIPINPVLPPPSVTPPLETNSSDPALKALVSYEHKFRYHFQISNSIYGCTKVKFEVCKRLVRETQVQERALETARGTLEVTFRKLLFRYNEFMKCFSRQHKAHAELLANFERDLERLRRVKLPTYLQREGRRSLVDLVKENELRKWAEACAVSHRQFEGKVFQLKSNFGELKRRVENLFEAMIANSAKDLDTSVKEHQRLVNEQRSIMQVLSKDVDTAKKRVDECSRPNLSASLRPHDAVSAVGRIYEEHEKTHLPNMYSFDEAISSFLEKCKANKNRMNHLVHVSMQRVKSAQFSIKDTMNELHAFQEVMGHQDRDFENLKLVSGIGHAYRACLAEVVRRRSNFKLYMGLAGQLAERLATERETEIRRREGFLRTWGRYVPHDMMAQMGLFDTPSQCNVNISPFDGDLLKIDLPDVERLAPLSLVGSGLGTLSNITKTDELSEIDDSDSVTIEGTSRIEVENAKLKAELASAIVIICGLNAEVGFFETSENGEQFEKTLKEMKEKTDEALALKDGYANHLESMLNSKQEQCNSYEKRIKELENKLSERYVQGQRDTGFKALEQMDESSSATSAFMEKITAPGRQPSKNILEGGDENMIDLISGSNTNNNPSAESTRNSMDASMNQTGDAEKEERLEMRDDTAAAGEAGIDQHQVLEEAVMELKRDIEEKMNLLEEAEEKIRVFSEDVKSLRVELEHSRNLLDESQMNCAHLENCLHEAREEARINKCAAERRAAEYEALRSSALKIHSLFERLRGCITAPGVPGLADSLRSLSLSLASSSKKDEGDEFHQCIKVLSDKVGFISRQSADLLEQCSRMETTHSHLVRELEEKRELIRNLYAKLQLEKQASKEKISFGRLEVHELAAFVRNSNGKYVAVNRNHLNYYLSDESVALFTEQHSTQPTYIIGQIVHIERCVVQCDMSGSRSGSGSRFGLNPYNLPVGSEYFVVTVALLPDTIRSSAS
ncbi:Autophagy-related protein 11 [Carex littledalei]|uniref:Autophagy-related protein 11 n=1 Tax=Carex littledalei TaxID=544730 RepID=A0A833QZG9_9POAL|nr:Autophagy-related protein 11 [Carex littledalei]